MAKVYLGTSVGPVAFG